MFASGSGMTFSLNGEGFLSVVEHEKFEQYLRGVKRDRLQAEWGAEWLLECYKRSLRGEYIMSLPFYAKNYDMAYRARDLKRLVPILSSDEVAETSSLSSSKGVTEDYLPDPKAELSYEDVDNELSRIDLVKEWSKLVTTVIILESVCLVDLLNRYLKDKQTSCCGRVPKRSVNYWNGESKVFTFKNEKELAEFKKVYQDEDGYGYSVEVCKCKQQRAKRSKLVRDIRTDYKLDALLLAVLSDPITAQMCLVDFYNLDGKYHYEFEKHLPLSHYEGVKEVGFNNMDWF